MNALFNILILCTGQEKRAVKKTELKKSAKFGGVWQGVKQYTRAHFFLNRISSGNLLVFYIIIQKDMCLGH